jgi:hypothetical protein
VTRRLVRFLISLFRLESARLNTDILTHFVNDPGWFVNEPTRELNELSNFTKTKLYAYHLRNN